MKQRLGPLTLRQLAERYKDSPNVTDEEKRVILRILDGKIDGDDKAEYFVTGLEPEKPCSQ